MFAIGSALTIALRIAPGEIWTTLFGAQFRTANGHSLPYLLALYAAATSIYSLSVVFTAYEMSYKIANTGLVQLAFGGVLIAGIYEFHSSLEQVIWVQIAIMSILLFVVAVLFLHKIWNGSEDAQIVFGYGGS